MVMKSFLLGALCVGVFGQAPAKPAPAKTAPAKPAAAKPNLTSEAALRARVSQFMQYHVEGKFSKAMELVAEDTKEQYFAGGKQRLKAFKLESVKLTDKNTKAVVTTIVTRDWDIRMQQHEVVIPMVTTWKVQKGQWFWYWDANGTWLTHMGPSKIEPLSKNPDGTIKGCPSLNTEQWAGGNVREHRIQDIWERSAKLRYTRDRTVDVFVRRLRQKIDKPASVHSFIQTRFGVGYKLEPEPK